MQSVPGAAGFADIWSWELVTQPREVGLQERRQGVVPKVAQAGRGQLWPSEPSCPIWHSQVSALPAEAL